MGAGTGDADAAIVGCMVIAQTGSCLGPNLEVPLGVRKAPRREKCPMVSACVRMCPLYSAASSATTYWYVRALVSSLSTSYLPGSAFATRTHRTMKLKPKQRKPSAHKRHCQRE